MKKILLATTMLAGTAGFAAAEVAVSGYAEIGIWSNAAGDVAFWQDVEVKFTGSGTTDGGLEFGAVIDLDETDVDVNDDNGTSVWVSGAFGKLTMGDTDGAIDWALADMDGGMTSIADDHSTHNAWFGGNAFDGQGDNQVVRYENTFGDVAFALSAEQENNGVSGSETILGVAVKYTANMGGTDVALGLGYQDAGDLGSAIGVSASAALAGGFGGKIAYIDYKDTGVFAPAVPPAAATGPEFINGGSLAGSIESHLGLEVSYKSGPIGVAVNYGEADFGAAGNVDSWGAVANYDLGGGAVAMFGYGSDVGGTSDDQWSLGLGLSF
ncbi:porin [Xinfangfangia sp. CPCC 101601]|uniref:Porin n=1 Tax=Pseudogemmobacter lacusdianii TaxID=3069608 RepID=A0ABU0VX64_9RHOB|nr:porin [Xinfangfangia sp. CPCC 101601]MDQ2066349.1 porin [Xinfangfangia sp. CPCC 101601]